MPHISATTSRQDPTTLAPADSADGLRHRCRNPHCKGKLSTPTCNARDAFCCRGCHSSFYRTRCVICEQPIVRKTDGQRVCRRPKCRSEFRRNKLRFLGGLGGSAPAADIPPRSAHLTGTIRPKKSDRAWRIIAGPVLAEINLEIPFDPELATRQAKLGAEVDEHLRKANRRAARKAQIQRSTPPVNIVGGYKFPGAPEIDLRPVVETAKVASCAASALRTDLLILADLSIPDFLKRKRSADPATERGNESAARLAMAADQGTVHRRRTS